MLRVFVFLLFLSSSLMAQDFTGLADINIDKEQIKTSLVQLNKMGKISDEDLKKALAELDGFSQGEVDALVKQGKDMAKQQMQAVPKQ